MSGAEGRWLAKVSGAQQGGFLVHDVTRAAAFLLATDRWPAGCRGLRGGLQRSLVGSGLVWFGRFLHGAAGRASIVRRYPGRRSAMVSAICSACIERQVSSPKPPPIDFVGLEGGEHLLRQRVEEHALEILGLLAQLLAGGVGVDDGRNGADHHITSISACSAPVALIAWRMAIRSRGEMPSALRPSTSSCSSPTP